MEAGSETVRPTEMGTLPAEMAPTVNRLAPGRSLKAKEALIVDASVHLDVLVRRISARSAASAGSERLHDIWRVEAFLIEDGEGRLGRIRAPGRLQLLHHFAAPVQPDHSVRIGRAYAQSRRPARVMPLLRNGAGVSGSAMMSPCGLRKPGLPIRKTSSFQQDGSSSFILIRTWPGFGSQSTDAAAPVWRRVLRGKWTRPLVGIGLSVSAEFQIGCPS